MPGRPRFFITPGGRVECSDNDLLSTVHRELEEECGFGAERITVVGTGPFYRGSHTMTKNGQAVAMTENFFLARLRGDSAIQPDRQTLTAEEQAVFAEQRWFALEELKAGRDIILPVNLAEVLEAIVTNQSIPAIDFTDPPGFGG